MSSGGRFSRVSRFTSSMHPLVSALRDQLRQPRRTTPKPPTPARSGDALLLETMEPRILLNADLTAGLAALQNEVDAIDAAISDLLDNSLLTTELPLLVQTLQDGDDIIAQAPTVSSLLSIDVDFFGDPADAAELALLQTIDDNNDDLVSIDEILDYFTGEISTAIGDELAKGANNENINTLITALNGLDQTFSVVDGLTVEVDVTASNISGAGKTGLNIDLDVTASAEYGLDFGVGAEDVGFNVSGGLNGTAALSLDFDAGVYNRGAGVSAVSDGFFGLNSLDITAGASTTDFEAEARFGFLGIDIDNGDIDLSGGLNALADSPLGALASDLGVQAANGLLTLAGDFGTVLDEAQSFALRIGDANEITVTVPAGDKGSAAGLVSAVQSAINSTGLNDLVSVSNSGGSLQFSVQGDGPGALGFNNISIANGANSTGGVAPTTGSAFSFVASSNGGNPQLVNVASGASVAAVAANVQTALNSAFGGGFTVTESGGRLNIAAAGKSLTVSDALALETRDDIAGVLADAITEGAGVGGETFSLDLDLPMDVVDDLVPDFDLTANLLPSNFSFDGDRFDFGSDLFSVVSTDVLNFNELSPAKVISLFNQIADFLGGLSNSEFVSGIDIPFANANLGDVLNFADVLRDTIIYDDLDDPASTETFEGSGVLTGIDRLTDANGTPSFNTAQELEDALNALPGISGVSIGYDAGTDELTFGLALTETFTAFDTDVDFNLPLGPVGNVQSDSSVSLSGEGSFNFDVGVDLGDDVGGSALLTGATLLSGLRSPVQPRTEQGITGDSAVTPALSADASFTLDVGGTIVPVVLDDADTSTNSNVLDLATDLRAALEGALDAAGLADDAVEVSTTGSRLVLLSDTAFTLTASGTAVTELGFAASASSNLDDIIITDKAGNSYGLSLNGIADIDALETAIEGLGGGGVFDLRINDAQTGLVLEDLVGGGGMLTVGITNDSTAGFALGIVGEETEDPDSPDPENPIGLGLIDGLSIAGATLADRVFIENASASGSVELDASSVNASATFGFVEIELDGGGQLEAGLSIGLKPVGGAVNERITLTELLDNVGNLGDLVDGPTLSVNPAKDTLSLDVSVDPSFPDFALTGGTPSLVLEVVDLGDPFASPDPVAPNINLTLPDFGDLAKFSDIGFEQILDGLLALTDFLDDFESFGFLNEPLPLIDTSVNDILGFVDKLSASIQVAIENPAGSLQSLEQTLSDALGIPDSLIGLDLDGDILKFSLDLQDGFSESLGLNFDLQDFIADLDLDPAVEALVSTASLAGSANLVAEGSFDLDLDFGIDLGVDGPESLGDVHIYNTTGITGTLNVAGQDLNFRGALGPVGLFVDEYDDGNTVTPAEVDIEVGLTAGVDIGAPRVLLSDFDIGSDFTVGLTPASGATATLPVFTPTESNFAGILEFTVDDLLSPSPSLTGLDDILGAFDPSNISLFDSLLLAVDGLDLVLGGVQDLLDGAFGDLSLPLIGDKLIDATSFIADFRDDFINPLRDGVAAVGDPDDDPIAGLLNQILGTNLDLLLSPVVVDTNIDDPMANPEDLYIEWDVVIGDDIANLDAGIGFDLGIPGLGLETEGDLIVGLDWEFAFGFGISAADGFYLKIDDPDELELTLDVDLPASITGTLGFLQLSASDRGNTGLDATFGIDIINRNDGSDDKLGFAELSKIGINPVMHASARADLLLELAVSGDVLGNDFAAVFPDLSAGFDVIWELGSMGAPVPLDSISGDAIQDGLQLVEFQDITLDLGSYINNVLGPILDQVNDIIEPVKPILDFLTEPLPVISDVGPDITLVDLAKTFGNVDLSFIESVAQVADLVSTIASFGENPDGLNFGDFTIFDASSVDPDMQPNLTDPKASLGNIPKPSTPPPAPSGGSGSATAKLISGEGFQFPILSDPGQIFGLLLGEPATLVTYDFGKFVLDFKYRQFFPIFGPLGASVGGQIGATFDFDFGFDTLGISQFADSGFRNPELIFNGFFISDTDQPDGSFGTDVPEIVVTGGLTASAELNLGIASGGVEGGVFTVINFDLFDPNRDGKVRIEELIGNFVNEVNYGTPALAPLAVFDVAGEIFVRLYAFLRINLLFITKNFEFDIVPPTTILEFGTDFFRPPQLATVLPNGVLRLNMGEYSEFRLNGNTNDVAENFEVRSIDGDTVEVTGIGFGPGGSDLVQTYEIGETLDRVIALGGEGNDTIDLDGISTANVFYEIEGGAGSDTISLGTGAGSASLVTGGAGNDIINGSAGDDQILGEEGNDTINGLGGNDLISGDSADIRDDSVRVREAAGDGNDIIDGGLGNDIIFGATGDDTLTAGGGDDIVIGDLGRVTLPGLVIEDTNRGLNGGKDTINGTSGLNKLFGGRGNDTITGGTDADMIFGEDGFDIIDGDGGADIIEGGREDDTIHGGDGGDTISGGQGADEIYGDGGADTIDGDGEGDEIHGGSGNDEIDGGDGGDLIYGDGDSDTIYGNIGGDVIYGDSSTDNDIDDAGVGTAVDPDGDSAGDTIYAGLGNDTVYGGGGDDTIFGDAGDDLIDGDWGDDTIDGDNGLGGDAGDDRIYGDFGDDDITSYEGNDFLDGAAGTDEYFVYVYGEAGSEDTDAKRVEIFDRGGIAAGADEATIFAPDDSSEQIFLLRASADIGGIGFVTTLNGVGEDILERIDYDGNLESLVINAYDGDDQFYVDDNRAVTRIEGGAGNDFFQIGQIFETLRDQPSANIADPRDVFATIETTVGFLSNGTSESMTINGGTGEDNFSVFHNKAVLTLNGNDGNDTFRVRAFALAGSQENLRDRTDISGGTDADTILYAVNAPVNIDGGDGEDTIIVTGTEFSDDFVITENGIFGGGLNINYVNIEILTVDGAEGDDRFFILGTSANAVTEVSGGLGSDSFNIAGDTPPIISNDLLGHSGIITHSVTSLDPDYNNMVAEGVSANVADDNEPAVRITPLPGDGGIEIFEGGGTAALAGYTIVLTRPPRPGETVSITAVAPELSQEEQDEGKEVLAFVDNGGLSDAAVLDGGTKAQVTFTAANWDQPQAFYYEAIDDGVAEGDHGGVINHTVASDFTIDFDGATGISNQLTNLVDNDASFVENELIGGLVRITGGTGEGQVRAIVDNTETELSLAFGWNIVPDNTSTYEIISSETPLGGTVDSAANRVTVTLSGANFEDLGAAAGKPANDQGNLRGATLKIVGGTGAGQEALILSSTDETLTLNRVWNVTPDSTSEFQISRYGGLAIPSIEVAVSEGAPTFVPFPDSPAPVPGVNIIESNGSTDVVEGIGGFQDSYQVVLTSQPSADVTVTVNVEDTITTRGNIFYDQPQVTVDTVELTFTPDNWDTPQTVQVGAAVDNVVDGGDTKVFAPIPKVVNKIQGELIINGAGGEGSRVDFDPKLLPGELNQAPSLGLVSGATATSISVAASEIPEDFGTDLTDFTLEIVSGTGAGQTRLISSSSVAGGIASLLIDEAWDVEPDGTSGYAISRTNPNFLVVESEQIDILTVFNNDSRSNDSGTLTSDTLSMDIMGGDIIYNDLENVTVNLGFGDDNLTVNSTHTRDDGFDTITMVNAGAGDDTIDVNLAADNGDFVVKGELGDDTIDAGDSALGVTMFGDEGQDTLTGGSGNDIIIGDIGRVDYQDDEGRITARFGLAHDFANMPDEVLVGDSTLLMPANQTDGVDRDPSLILSLDTVTGDVDTLVGNDGDDIIIGGQSGDTIDSGADNDIVGGDALVLTYTGGSAGGETSLVSISTLDVDNGGIDSIVAGTGNDTVLGGRDGDTVTASAGNNLLLGDHGTISYTAGLVDEVDSTDVSDGGADTITSGDGHDTIIGGTDGDTLTSAAGDDIVLGDSGTLVADPVLTSAARIILSTLEATDFAIGGVDTIDLGEDDDIAIAGAAGDTVTASGGNNRVIGDSGTVAALPGAGTASRPEIDSIVSTAVAIGGDDTITTGAGEDIIIGGIGGDSITAGDGNNVVIGDNGEIDEDTADVDFNLLTTFSPNDGGNDTITTGADNDIILGGTGSDEIRAGAGNDHVMGDHGKLEGDVDGDNNPVVAGLFTFTSLDTQNSDDGAADLIFGEAGDDIIIGQQGADIISGGADDDDITGGHNVSDGEDEGDIIDAGSGDDVVAGDNAIIERKMTTDTIRARVLNAGTIYDDDGNVLVDSARQDDPDGADGRDITIIDHADDTRADIFGDDYIAGGADNDRLFGQLGDDTVLGDSTILDDLGNADLTVTAERVGGVLSVTPTVGLASDGDDYVEGGGGEDVIFGGLGQDDLVGGSSSMFGLTTEQQRPDGSDFIIGSDGQDIGRNDPGSLHARDADSIAGDNANITRLTDGAGNYLTFSYDNYGEGINLIPRAVDLLDYTRGGIDFDPAAAADNGAADEVHGGDGDDSVYGMVGDDVLYGDGQDDDLIGGYGLDWISGGDGDDGVLGDDGRIYTSRNGAGGEALYGIAAIPAGELDLTISTPGNAQVEVINISGELKKSVNLTPFNVDPAGDTLFDPTDADDIIYGGLGNDFLHGGSGDDAMSGAEALAQFWDNPVNPGDVLGWGQTRAGEFNAYDEDNPLDKVFVDANGVFDSAGSAFLLNFDATEGPVLTGAFPTDGNDRIFGDLGNDWIVGGSGQDTLWGGWGDDLLNADDDHDTNGGANDQPDTDINYEDRAFGGAGRDILIGNTGGDRLIDWSGEFNSYIVPFSPFGQPTVSRGIPPALVQFLYDLGEADGADMTRAADEGTDPARNGEPLGELGLIIQSDDAWGDQRGAPDDPQAGNGKAQRDVRVSAGDGGNGNNLQAADLGDGVTTTLTQAQLDAAVAAAITQWEEAGLLKNKDRRDLSGVTWNVVDFAGSVLGQDIDSANVHVDSDAAGHGWFIDATPNTSEEFTASAGNALVAEDDSPALGRIDLLTAVHHEIAHVLGYEHYDQDGLLAEYLAAGSRYTLDTLDTEDTVTYIFDDASGEIAPDTDGLGSIADTPVVEEPVATPGNGKGKKK